MTIQMIRRISPNMVVALVALFCHLGLTIAPAYAEGWQVTGQERRLSHVQKLVTNLEGEKAFVDNNLGAAILRIPARQASKMKFSYSFNTPYVFAKYSADNAAGSISIMKLLKMPNGDVVVVQKRFTPDDGQLFASKFGMNPFEQFRGGESGSFIHILPSAFWSAVGLAMRHYQSNVGYIAAAETRTDTQTTKSGGLLRKKVTTTMTAFTKPVWVMAVPSGVGVGLPQAYKLPNGNVVEAGVNFISQGIGHNMPSAEYVSFQHSESKSSWTGLAMIVFTAVLVAVTFGVAAYAAPALMATFAGSMSIGTAAAIGAAVGATANFAFNAIASGGDYGLMGGNSQVFGGQTDLNPNTRTSAWDYRQNLYAGAGSLVQSDVKNAPGDFGAGFQRNQLSPAKAVSSPGVQKSGDSEAPSSDSQLDLGIGSLVPAL